LRLFNAGAALEVEPAAIAAFDTFATFADTMSVRLSKGLSAQVQ